MSGRSDIIDAACACETAERERAIVMARSWLHLPGRDDCADCGEAIAPARRAALPSARRCILCQARYEGPSTGLRMKGTGR